MNFEGWAQEVDALIRATVPDVRIERDLEDMYRWTYGADDVQAHACGEKTVVLIALGAGTGAVVRRLTIGECRPADVAREVVEYLATTRVR
jgi:hypothetical protein